MLIEFAAYLVSSIVNVFSIFAGADLLNVAAVFLSLVAVYNLFLYGIYRGAKPTLVPPIFITVTSLHMILKLFKLPDYLADLALLAAMLVLLGLYWDYYSVRDALNNATPVILLVSTLLGVWVGLATPVRYSLASIIDVIVYRLLKERYSLGIVLKYLVFLEFLIIYLNPVLYVGTYALMFNLFLFFVKVTFHEKYKSKTPYVINLDVLLKPLVVGWLT